MPSSTRASTPGPTARPCSVDEPLVDQSLNAQLLARGHAYPAFYATLPVDLRTHLAKVSEAARAAQPPVGLWPRSTADPDGPATVANLGALEGLVLWPKLFRRLVPYLAAGFPNFDGLDAWLRAHPVNRDDELFLLDKLERGNMHDVVRGVGSQIQLTVWPEDFVISPDPIPGGGSTGPGQVAAGDVLIVAALPDPVGTDRGNELITLLNTTLAAIDLAGWGLVDAAGGRNNLSGTLAGGQVVQVTASGALQLGNQGDTVVLVDPSGASIDQVTYKADRGPTRPHHRLWEVTAETAPARQMFGRRLPVLVHPLPSRRPVAHLPTKRAILLGIDDLVLRGRGMDNLADRLQGWMDGYVRAWNSNDPAAIAALFTEDAAYYPEPYSPPWRGRDEIVRRWLERKDEPGDTEFRWHPIAVAQEVAVVQGQTIYRSSGRTYSNLWIIRLDGEGRCTEFTEWWMQHPDRDSSAPRPAS